jgi:hypothetical protein
VAWATTAKTPSLFFGTADSKGNDTVDECARHEPHHASRCGPNEAGLIKRSMPLEKALHTSQGKTTGSGYLFQRSPKEKS